MTKSDSRRLKIHKPVRLAYNPRATLLVTRHYRTEQSRAHECLEVPNKAQHYAGAVHRSDHDLTAVSTSPKSESRSFKAAESLEQLTCGRKKVIKHYRFHGREREYAVRLRILDRVCETLSSILAHNAVGTLDALSDVDAEVITAVLRRKVEGHGLSGPKTGETAYELEAYKTGPGNSDCATNGGRKQKVITALMGLLKPSKRVEENNKFVYKHTNAYMYNRYVRQHGLAVGKDSEKKFYEHYFADFALAQNASVNDFCDPARVTVGQDGRKNAKSLNTEYLLRILSCEKYKRDFFEYVKTDFVNDYISAIGKKLSRLLMPLESKLRVVKPELHVGLARDFASTKISSKWCKIPWSCEEVAIATSHFITYFNKLLYVNRFLGIRVAAKLTLHPNIFEAYYNDLLRLEASRVNVDEIVRHLNNVLPGDSEPHAVAMAEKLN